MKIFYNESASVWYAHSIQRGGLQRLRFRPAFRHKLPVHKKAETLPDFRLDSVSDYELLVDRLKSENYIYCNIPLDFHK